MFRSRYLAVASLVLLASLLLCGCSKRPEQSSERKVVLTVWHPWGGTQAEAFEATMKAFEAVHPNVDVRALFTPNDLSNNQKFFTSVAARRPPDVIYVDGPQVAEWAEQGALTELDSLISRDGIRAEDYFAPCWQQTSYRGRVWAMTYCADPNFAFVWNRAHFREAGLDPDRPPETIAELDRYVRKLNKWRKAGATRKLSRIGIIPWAQYGPANSMFTWGWAFGGDFYDPETHKITASSPEVVRALTWMCRYAEEFDVEKIEGLAAGFGTAEQNPLYTGKLSMTCLHISGIEEIRKYAPDLDYGIGYIPAPASGEAHSSWVGGWCMAIPRGSHHPKEAWELIRWLCADPNGTTVVGRESGLFPGWRKSPYLKEVSGKPGYGMFLKILEECRHQRPVMPAQAYYMGALQRAVDSAMYGRKTPKEALREAEIETQRELDLVLGGK